MRALVIEGGGMRAAYANGVLAAFEEAGHTAFDAVYGTSAGGALAAWFTAGQAREAALTWRYADDARILSYARFFLGQGPLLDHERLFEIVYQQDHPLDTDAIEAADHPVIVTVTDADTGELHYRDIRQGPVLEWLKATGRLPLGTGDPVELEGRRWLDGGLVEPVPLAKPIEDGADHITLILNRSTTRRKSEPWIVEKLVARKFPALEGLITEHHALYEKSLALLEDPPAGVELQVIRPTEDLPLHRLSRDLDALDTAISLGEQDGWAFLRDDVATDGQAAAEA